ADATAGTGASVWRQVYGLNVQLRRDPQRLPVIADALDRLQARIDHETEEFLQEAAAIRQASNIDELKRQATHFMQHHLEQFQATMESLASQEHLQTAVLRS